jgi:hypothetical protein
LFQADLWESALKRKAAAQFARRITTGVFIDSVGFAFTKNVMPILSLSLERRCFELALLFLTIRSPLPVFEVVRPSAVLCRFQGFNGALPLVTGSVGHAN